MLEHGNVPKKYWVEAVDTAVYLLNQSPTQAVKGKTLEEAWTGRNPRISHLKVFGSLAYVWILDAKHSKLDSKSQKLMFIGYSDNHKAYRLIDVDIDHLMFSRNVVFDEEWGPFQLSSSEQNSEDRPLKATDLGVCLPFGSLDGRDDAKSKFDDALPKFPPMMLIFHLFQILFQLQFQSFLLHPMLVLLLSDLNGGLSP